MRTVIVRSDPNFRRGRSPQRFFGSWLLWTADSPGLWRGGADGHSVMIEKRRAEPGCPRGWYYFGVGHPDGAYAGSRAEHAAEMAMDALDRARHFARTEPPG